MGEVMTTSGVGMDVNVVNAPGVLAEVTAAFTAYEQALVANDIPTLRRAFWASERAVRFGIGERLYGASEIDAWRRCSPGPPAGRRVGRTIITTYGRDAACVSIEFSVEGTSAVGRQSQTWIRLHGGWKIVAAHVSVEGA